MAKFALHLLSVPRDVQTRTSSTIQRNVGGRGVLEGGAAAVEAISLEPGERALVGTFRGERAQMLAQRFEELFDAGDIEAVAYFGLSESTQQDGYYALRNIDVQPSDPRIDPHQQFSGVLIKEGTRQSHFRAVRTAISQVTNDFGTDTTAHVGIPATATKIKWLDPTDKSTEAVTLVATRNAEHGDVEIYDADASTFDNPTLLYELPYSDEGKTDCRLYDDRGNASKTDGNSNLQWQSVYRATHDVEGGWVASNGLFRLYLDEANNAISAEEWDNGTSSWSSVSLGAASGWQIRDVDWMVVGLARVKAQVEWEDTDDGTLFALNMTLHRGYNYPQWVVPEDETTNSGTTPSDLQTHLDPIANGDVLDPGASAAVVARSDVRK